MLRKILATGSVPVHVAMIMDGNGRWAGKRCLPRVEGHRAGVERVREVVETAGDLGVKILTLYTFSTENWCRPIEEISMLMTFLAEVLQREIDDLDRNNVRLRAMGRLELLPVSVQEELDRAGRRLADNTGLILNLALSYSGRAELVDAVRKLVSSTSGLPLDPLDITEETLSEHLYTADLADPDLLIRTSGEMRISNFMLWQLAYSEIWVTDVLWPDFRRMDFLRAVRDYQARNRRFGGVTSDR
ncbi:MAG: isoprenyl transferase [Candidatus Eisenbacteria sp.]|nr:isoprenyl transferase [Candidatus Eisenbacteria bacterium]